MTALTVWFVSPYSSLNSAGGNNALSPPYGPTPKPGPPTVEKSLVTLSGVEVNKKKTGKGSPWVRVVEGPVTFDLLEIASNKAPQFLGSIAADPGEYRIIRMQVDKMELKLSDREELVPAKLASNKIQIVEKFTVVAGETTRLRMELDRKTSLKQTGAGEYIFKPVVTLTVVTGSGTTQLEFTPNPPKDTELDGDEGSGRGWVRELQGRWPGVLG